MSCYDNSHPGQRFSRAKRSSHRLSECHCGYTDEWAYRVALALAWGYDWLYDALSEDERDTVREALVARTRDVADHAMRHASIQLFPYLIDAANLLKSATGLDLYSRPFFQKTADFPLYTKAPDTRRGTVGDDSTMGDLPCTRGSVI